MTFLNETFKQEFEKELRMKIAKDVKRAKFVWDGVEIPEGLNASGKKIWESAIRSCIEIIEEM